LGKLYDAIRGHSFNAGVALGEARQTLDLAALTATRLGRAILLLKRGNLRNAMSLLGQGVTARHQKSFDRQVKSLRTATGLRSIDDRLMANLWLECRYGWMPLLNDVKEASKAWEQASLPKRPNRVQASHTVKAQGNTNSIVGGLGSYTDWSMSIRRTIYVELSDTFSPTSARSMGLLDPASVAWELLPFSFVVDWFIPIGSYISLSSQLPGVKCTAVHTSTGTLYKASRTTVSSENVWNHDSPPTYHKETHSASATVRGMNLARSSGANLLNIPSPGFKPLSKALSTGHLENALALLTLAVRR